MNFFETEEEQSSIENHGIWAEKYRPSNLNQYIADDSVKQVMQSFIDKKQLPHLMLHGNPGCGKTSLAKILVSHINCDLLYVNASDNNGIDFVRDKIRPFAASAGFNDLKIVILDEFDFSSISAQSSLRNLMETYSATTRFILTCNYIEKIIDPIISRCQVFKIEPPSKKQVAIYLKNILDSENVKYDLIDIKTIVVDFYPDVRKIVNYAQQSCLDGKINHIQTKKVGTKINEHILHELKKNNEKSFSNIRQAVADSEVKSFDELYRMLFSSSEEICDKNESLVPMLITTIAEYSFQNSMVVDKEITFMACIASILKLLNG